MLDLLARVVVVVWNFPAVLKVVQLGGQDDVVGSVVAVVVVVDVGWVE